MLILAPPVGAASWHFLKDPYRWNRILAWLDPWSQSNASAYQARESLVAILTGGWTGKGLGNGMTKLGYLPEDSSDFIFSVFCEEWGFVGSLLLMGLVLMWIWHAWKAAARARDRFGQVLAGSLGFLIAFQAVLHIAVAIVVAPTTGMGLPFISAGGTSLIITVAAAAMIISVSAHRCAAVAGLAGELASAAPPVEPARRIAGMLPAKA
jgi:cell division protein FtsW